MHCADGPVRSLVNLTLVAEHRPQATVHGEQVMYPGLTPVTGHLVSPCPTPKFMLSREL